MPTYETTSLTPIGPTTAPPSCDCPVPTCPTPSVAVEWEEGWLTVNTPGDAGVFFSMGFGAIFSFFLMFVAYYEYLSRHLVKRSG